MDIRNSLDGLKSLLGVDSVTPAATGASRSATTNASSLGSDRATLSSAGNEVSQTAREEGARMDKVAMVQAALAVGTYEVPAAAVASKVVDAMLGGNK